MGTGAMLSFFCPRKLQTCSSVFPFHSCSGASALSLNIASIIWQRLAVDALNYFEVLWNIISANLDEAQGHLTILHSRRECRMILSHQLGYYFLLNNLVWAY